MLPTSLLPSAPPPVAPARMRMMQSLKVEQLKDCCGRLRLSKAGLKADLQARLMAALSAPASRAAAEKAVADVYALAHGVVPAVLSPLRGGAGGAPKVPFAPPGGSEAYRAALVRAARRSARRVLRRARCARAGAPHSAAAQRRER
jgi:hypothetical protein